MTKFLSINEVCKESGLSQHLIRNMVKNNQLPYIKSGCKILINYPLACEVLDRMCNGGDL